jgi:hypothetical protein
MVESAQQQQTRKKPAQRIQPKKAPAKSAIDSPRPAAKCRAKQPRSLADSASTGGPNPQPTEGLSRCGQKRSGKGTRRPNSRPRSPSLPNLDRRSGCSPAEPYPPSR